MDNCQFSVLSLSACNPFLNQIYSSSYFRVILKGTINTNERRCDTKIRRCLLSARPKTMTTFSLEMTKTRRSTCAPYAAFNTIWTAGSSITSNKPAKKYKKPKSKRLINQNFSTLTTTYYLKICCLETGPGRKLQSSALYASSGLLKTRDAIRWPADAATSFFMSVEASTRRVLAEWNRPRFTAEIVSKFVSNESATLLIQTSSLQTFS